MSHTANNRPLRLCNPLCIRHSANRWQGMADEQDDPHFVRFRSMEWGWRAAFRILRTYRQRYHIYTIADIIRRWAPPSENDTTRYIRNVCGWMNHAGHQSLEPAEWPLLLQAMARQETGRTFPLEEIEKGLKINET